MTSDPVIRQLRERDYGRTAAMLARAFMEAPLTRVLAPDPVVRDAASRWLFGTHLRYANRWGEAWAAVGPRQIVHGAAIWWSPDYVDVDDERRELSGLANGLQVVGPAAWSQIAELGRAMADLHKTQALDLHWYLAVLGVDPAARGQGLAGYVLRPMLDRLDTDHLPGCGPRFCSTWDSPSPTPPPCAGEGLRLPVSPSPAHGGGVGKGALLRGTP